MALTLPRVQQTSELAAKAKTVLLWLLQIIAASLFFMAGFAKLTGSEEMIGMFDAIGIGQWFRIFTGLIEVGGAALLLVPRTAGVGALFLMATMIGALITHLAVIGGDPSAALFLLLVLSVIAWARRHSVLNLLQKRTGPSLHAKALR